MPCTPIVAPADLVSQKPASNGLILQPGRLRCGCHAPNHGAREMISGSNGADRRSLAVGLAVAKLLAGSPSASQPHQKCHGDVGTQ